VPVRDREHGAERGGTEQRGQVHRLRRHEQRLTLDHEHPGSDLGVPVHRFVVGVELADGEELVDAEREPREG
jgi:hypothetical protein